MFKTRLLSGILLVIIGACNNYERWIYTVFYSCSAVSLIGMSELYKAMNVQKEKNYSLAGGQDMRGQSCIMLLFCCDFQKYGMLGN